MDTERFQQKLLEGQVQEHLKGSWLGIIPRANVLFFGRKTLISKLQETYPKIYNIDVSTHATELELTIEEREAHSLWCVEREYESVFDEECYFADQRGFWYAQAPYFSDNVFLKVYLDPKEGHIETRRAIFRRLCF